MSNERKVYEDDCDTELSEWEAQLNLLKVTADKGSSEERKVLSKSLGALTLKQEEAKKKLADLKSAGNDVWERFKTEMDVVRMNLRSFFCNTAARLVRVESEEES